MNKALRIIHIEDVATDAELVERTLRKSGLVFDKIIVDTREEYEKAILEFRPDIVLSDHSLPAFNSLEALKMLKSNEMDIPFILITSTVSEEFAVSVMREGASDYVLKDRLQRLPGAIRNALEKRQAEIDKQLYLNKIVGNEALFSKAEIIAEFGTWRYEIETKRLNWSAGTYALLGYTLGEVEPTVEHFKKNIYSEDLRQVGNIFKNAADLYSAQLDFRVVNADGTIRYVHAQFELEMDMENEPDYLVGFNQDVTRSKLAEIEVKLNIEELKAAGNRQSAILNALPPNIVLLNQDGKIVAVNESWRKFTIENNLGIPKYGIDYSYVAISEKATGVDAESAKKIALGIKEVVLGITDEFSLEYSCYSKSKKVWYQIIVAPLADKTKKGAVVLHIDITARKLAEELRLQSEANLTTIFENTDVAYVLCDTENKIVSFNSKANDLCVEQFNKKLKIGRRAFSYFPKSKIPNLKRAIQKVLNNETVSYETSYHIGNGHVKWYEVKWIGVPDKEKTNIGFILAFKDISARKVADIEREKIAADLIRRNLDLEQFTYMVSHNLRAPVANIMGLSNMLDGIDFNTEADEANHVRGALAKSINMLDEVIMDMNHILQVNNPMMVNTELVNVRLLTEEIIYSLDNLVKNENVTVNYDFKTEIDFKTVKGYLHSIFYNLTLNAIKYKQPGIDPVITISAEKVDDKLVIGFKDNGKGIDEKHLKNLFGLYRRFDTTVEGKGMGLFMVKIQVENLGGTIQVESKLGEGTTFKLEFPEFRNEGEEIRKTRKKVKGN